MTMVMHLRRDAHSPDKSDSYTVVIGSLIMALFSTQRRERRLVAASETKHIKLEIEDARINIHAS